MSQCHLSDPTFLFTVLLNYTVITLLTVETDCRNAKLMLTDQ